MHASNVYGVCVCVICDVQRKSNAALCVCVCVLISSSQKHAKHWAIDYIYIHTNSFMSFFLRFFFSTGNLSQEINDVNVYHTQITNFHMHPQKFKSFDSILWFVFIIFSLFRFCWSWASIGWLVGLNVGKIWIHLTFNTNHEQIFWFAIQVVDDLTTLS